MSDDYYPLGPGDLALDVVEMPDGSVIYLDPDEVVEPRIVPIPTRKRWRRSLKSQMEDYRVQMSEEANEMVRREVGAEMDEIRRQLEEIKEAVLRDREVTHIIERDDKGRMTRVVSESKVKED